MLDDEGKAVDFFKVQIRIKKFGQIFLEKTDIIHIYSLNHSKFKGKILESFFLSQNGICFPRGPPVSLSNMRLW